MAFLFAGYYYSFYFHFLTVTFFLMAVRLVNDLWLFRPRCNYPIADRKQPPLKAHFSLQTGKITIIKLIKFLFLKQILGLFVFGSGCHCDITQKGPVPFHGKTLMALFVLLGSVAYW